MPYLQKCMESVLNQSFKKFDIWLLDNGNTDDSLTYLRSLNDSRIQIIETDKRLSITENWDQIRNLSVAKYATILGQDNILKPDFWKK